MGRDGSQIVYTPGGNAVNFIPNRAVVVTPADDTIIQNGILYIGVTGDVKCLPTGNAADGWVTFKDIAAGTFLPIYVKAIHTDTTATDMLICY
jgi:hypothetical protein